MRRLPDFNDNDLVVGYYRFSSRTQNEASIEQQRERVRRWATSQGLQVVREYDDPARTGTNTDRPGFQQMLRELPSIKPAYVAVWKNDRLGRDRSDLLRVKNTIRLAGARLHYIEGFSPTDDPDSILVEGLSDAFAEYYSRQLAVNIRRGVEYNAKNALSNGRKIFGFLTGPDKRYVLDPDTAPVVAQVFADYARGKSMQRIADDLNATGVRTANGYSFTAKTLNKLMSSRFYIGEYSYAGHVVPGGMPRIVDDVTFEEVQKKFAVNKRRGAKTKAELADLGAALRLRHHRHAVLPDLRRPGVRQHEARRDADQAPASLCGPRHRAGQAGHDRGAGDRGATPPVEGRARGGRREG